MTRKKARSAPDVSGMPTKAVDRRRTQSRQALIVAGIDLFGKANADTISVDEIASMAGVTKQTFYNHFKDKQVFLQLILAEVRGTYEAQCAAVNIRQTDPARRFARALCVYARLAMDDPRRGGIVARMLSDNALVDSELNRGVVRDLTDGLTQGRFSVPAMDIAVSFSFGIAQALVMRVISCSELSTATILAQQFGMLSLRAFGLGNAESEVISAQAADQIVRLGIAQAVASESL